MKFSPGWRGTPPQPGSWAGPFRFGWALWSACGLPPLSSLAWRSRTFLRSAAAWPVCRHSERKEEDARRELTALTEELAAQYWRGSWWGEMDYLLWKMARGGSTDGWPAESLPTDQQLRRLRDLSQRAGGWWHRLPVAEPQEGKSP